MLNRVITTGGIWAENADDIPIGTTPTTGVTYVNPNLASGDIDTAWPYKTVVDSANTNEILKRLTTLMMALESNGILSWCANTAYSSNSVVIGSDGAWYRGIVASPSGDPVLQPTQWALYNSQFLAYNGTAVDSVALGGRLPANTANNIPISNGTVNENLNAELLSGLPGSHYAPVPAGTIFHTARQDPPLGYLVCDGSAIDRTDYAVLRSAIGELWGHNDVNDTFNLPDLRGMFIRGHDSGGAHDSGREFGSDQLDTFAAHTHTQVVGVGAPTWAATSGSGPGGYGSNTGSTGDTETRPVNIALLPIIKY